MLNLKSYLKFLSRNKLYTFINVLGLSVSLMFVILIANYTVNELTIDSFQENAENIYLLGDEQYNTITAYRIGENLANRYPEIKKTCGVISTYSSSIKTIGNNHEGSIICVDTTFFDMFSFELKQGNRNRALISKNSVIISERFANKIFGELNPIGQTMQVSDTLTYVVSGVVENFENSLFNYVDMIMNIENMNHFGAYALDRSMSMKTSSTVMFVQTVKGANLKIEDITTYIKSLSKFSNDSYKATLTPMRDYYFILGKSSGPIESRGDKFVVIMLLVIGALILGFAILNYINLTVSQTGFRAKEMATRRLLGARKHSIFLKMIYESTLLCFVAFICGLFLAISVEPYTNELISANIVIIDDISVTWVLSYAVIIALLGVISGLVPAIVVSRFKPIDVVKGRFTFKSKMIYSKIFITIQSIITIIFIACSITAVRQVQYLVDADLGYNQKGILYVHAGLSDNKKKQFNNRLKELPYVNNIGHTNSTPFEGYESQTLAVDIVGNINFHKWYSDFATMNILGLDILRDNNISGDGVWLNETAMKMINATEDTKSLKVTLWNGSKKEFIIKGVVADFMQGDIIEGKTHPTMFELDDKQSYQTDMIQIYGDFKNSHIEVEKILKEIIGDKDTWYEIIFIDQLVANFYERYERLSKIILIFTLITILISSLGLLAMSVYFIRQRSTEIAVRKVFGSTNTQVLKKLVWQFLRLVVVAFFISCPIIWYVMSEWLKEFPYRINLSVWIFIAAGVFTLLISFITVYWHSNIAANENPTKSIKK